MALSDAERKIKKREYNKQWAQNNQDKIKLYRQTYYKKHKERLNSQSEAYRKAHLAEINEYHKRRRADGIENYNSEYMTKYMQKYRANDVGEYSVKEYIRHINRTYNVSVTTLGEALAVQYFNRCEKLKAQVERLKDVIETEKSVKIKYKQMYKDLKAENTELKRKYKKLNKSGRVK